MRYVVIARGLPLGDVESECRRLGGKNIKVARAAKQVFCELEAAAADRLAETPGLVVKVSKEVRPPVMPPITREPQQGYEVLQPVYAASQASLFTMLYLIRELLSPPVLGTGCTTVVIDTGVRSTHRGLRGKVVYEANFSTSETTEDIFNHGTGVAYLVAGGIHQAGQESGVAPGSSIMNLKAINDEGVGSEESVILALEEACEVWKRAEAEGLHPTDPMYPNVVNMSLGSEDDGDPDNPIRVAITEIYAEVHNKLILKAAAGNAGPNPETIMLPAACPEVWAIGAVTFSPFQIWEYSSRGPVDGLVKPDVAWVGVDMLTASSLNDDDFIVKSGTSFSCPVAAGLFCLLGEVADRFGLLDIFYATPRDQMELFMAAVSRKPEGAPIEKDNAYGWGLPMGDLVIRQLGVGAAALPQVFNAVIGIGMLGMMMPIVTR